MLQLLQDTCTTWSLHHSKFGLSHHIHQLCKQYVEETKREKQTLKMTGPKPSVRPKQKKLCGSDPTYNIGPDPNFFSSCKKNIKKSQKIAVLFGTVSDRVLYS